MDFSVEFLDAGEESVATETYVGKTGLVALLYQLIHDLQNDQTQLFYCEAGGLNVRRLYSEGD
jgi:hypothetical protein